MAFLPHDHDQIVADIVADRAKPTHGLVGALPDISIDLIESFARAALEFAAKNYGDEAATAILQYKDQIRAVIGPAVLAAADQVIHGLQDLKIAKP